MLQVSINLTYTLRHSIKLYASTCNVSEDKDSGFIHSITKHTIDVGHVCRFSILRTYPKVISLPVKLCL